MKDTTSEQAVEPASEMRLSFNRDVKVSPFDGQNAISLQYCEIPAAGDTVSRLLVPTHLVEWLQSFNGTQDTTERIQSYVKREPHRYTERQLEQLVYNYCIGNGLLHDASAATPRLPEVASRAPYVRMKVTLLTPWLVRILSAPMRPLFTWPLFVALLPLFVLSHFIFYAALWPDYRGHIRHMRGVEMLLVMAAVTAMGLLHELGHAAALGRHGHRRASIGWGMYLIYPVFWTDLSDAWRLKRWDRAMVDAGGIYMHLVGQCVLIGVCAYINAPVLAYCVVAVDWQIITSLNPVLRTDAFWLAGDIFGIANLRDHSLGLIERVAAKFLPWVSVQHRITPLSSVATTFLVTYTIAVFIFGLALSIVGIRQIVMYVIPSYPGVLAELWRSTANGELLRALDQLLTALMKGLILYGFGMAVIGLIRWMASLVGGAVLRKEARTRP